MTPYYHRLILWLLLVQTLENVGDSALFQKSQEPFQLFSVDPVNESVSSLLGGQGAFHHELEAYAVISPADGAGMHGDGALGGFISEVCPLQGHEDQGAGVPALFGDHIEAGGTDGACRGVASYPPAGRPRYARAREAADSRRELAGRASLHICGLGRDRDALRQQERAGEQHRDG